LLLAGRNATGAAPGGLVPGRGKACRGHAPADPHSDSGPLCHAARVTAIKLGVQLSAQCDDWSKLLGAARLVDDLGFDYVFMPDHLAPLSGSEDSVMFEGIVGTAAIAASTRQVRIGLLVASNTFRHPTVLAKSVATIDHVSGGRAILGLGAGWHEREHQAWGVDFGRSAGHRLEWLDEALSIVRPLLAGETVTHAGERYRTDTLILSPRPVQERLPILVGGVGERKTLLSVARYADMWNAQVNLDGAQHKIDVLSQHCEQVGRDSAEIEFSIDCAPTIRDTEEQARAELAAVAESKGTIPPGPGSSYHWVGSPKQVAERMAAYVRLGFTTITCSAGQPYDEETLTRLIRDVKPLVEAA
jgi:alkanesulfonate monooxygenase SsuD/methylene tetrahydromethanopterin reductase-like flavin-dependent oxidoreductase (luciferase family)